MKKRKKRKMGYNVPIRPPRVQIKKTTEGDVYNVDNMDELSSRDAHVGRLIMLDKFRSGGHVCYAKVRGDSPWEMLSDPDFNINHTSYRMITTEQDEVLRAFQDNRTAGGEAVIVQQLDTYNGTDGLIRTDRRHINSVQEFFDTYRSKAKYFYSGEYRNLELSANEEIIRYTNNQGEMMYRTKSGRIINRNLRSDFYKSKEELDQEEANKIPKLGIQKPKKSLKERREGRKK